MLHIKHQLGSGRFTAAALSYNSEELAFINIKGDSVNSLKIAPLCKNLVRLEGILFVQALGFYKFFSHSWPPYVPCTGWKQAHLCVPLIVVSFG